MIPILYRYVGGALVVLLVLGGLYLYGYNKGQDNVQAKFDDYKNAAQVAYDKQVAENKTKEAINEKLSRRIQDELEPALATATADGASLARRLRNHSSRSCALPAKGQGTGSPVEASGESADGEGTGSAVDDALEAHLQACARDATRLDGWREFWNGLE
jgi:hypothetical protein